VLNTKNFFQNRCLLLAGLLSILVCTACTGSHRAVDPSAAMVPDRIYKSETSKGQEGSLWHGDSSTNSFFVDAKGKRVGDIIRVVVNESASSQQTATTGTSKDSDINFQTSAMLGLPSNLGIQNFLGMGTQFDPSVNASTSKSNQGSGTTTRGGTLTATISATIIEVLPNGNFRIEGTRSVTVNNEEQIMVLRGVVRPVDINFDNTILSTMVADASITYTGEGVVADEQRVGWGMRLLSFIWPF
jgi:flagellar L-ring protein precursor FlgH